jgi:carboxyl-terminal processing protease
MSAPRSFPTPDDSAPVTPPAGSTAKSPGGPGTPVADGSVGPEVEPVDGKPARGASHGPRTIDGSRFSLLIVAILVGSALFVGGYTLGSRVSTTPGTPASQEAQFAPFWDVYSLIRADYAGSPRPSEDQLVRAAINGMMESLKDQWSYYQQPSDFENSVLGVGGQAVGIGVSVQLQPVQAGATTNCQKIGNGCELAIIEPFPGSPAAGAGILAGDVIAGVDGTSLDGLSIDDATAKIKGSKGTPVTLTIQRGNRTLDVTIVRNVYDRPQVETRTLANGQVAYIAVSGINDPAYSQFHLALSNALAAGQKSIILDLRGNPGGYVPDATKMASDFISSGPILYQEDSSATQTEIDANAKGLATDPSIKIVVLVDGNTASAAEIAAGAIQARGRGLLVGQKTYGKGVFQEYLPLSNNDGGIHLTVGRWLTPNKVWIQGTGLTPDIAATNDGARAGTDPVLDAGLVALGYPAESGASASPSPAPSAAPGASGAPSAVPSAVPSIAPSPSAS